MPNTQYTNRLLLNAPVDKNVNRDKAIDDCSTVYIDIQNGSNQVKLKRLVISNQAKLNNGILTDLSAKVVKKMVSFIPMTASTKKGGSYSILAKSKALDT